ncbi:MAG: lysophospholipid acyltransferase family protein [Desulfobulbaceae bacterium]|jgi:predicted LPLAT superfamily acyltransferase|nr:lysophospholipid acyltransferase family protein [Desulfobulbaceae bacterium]
MKKTGKQLGPMFFYLMIFIGGQRLAYLVLHPVVLAYVVCSTTIHKRLGPYVNRRFPHGSWLHKRVQVYQIIIGLGKMLIDRALLGIKPDSHFEGTFEGLDRLQDILDSGSGAVVVLAHVGTWQTAMAHLAGLNTKIHAIMAHNEEAMTKHFYEMGRSRSFQIIDAQGFMGGMIEAAAILAKGELVLIMGDRAEGGQTMPTQFLGSPINLPVAAYNLAAVTNTPIIIAFSVKTGTTSHTLKIWDIIHPHFAGREKKAELSRCVSRFSKGLQDYVEQYPHQWGNFFDIWQQ